MATHNPRSFKSYIYDYSQQQWTNRTNNIRELHIRNSLDINQNEITQGKLFAIYDVIHSRVFYFVPYHGKLYCNNGNSFNFDQLSSISFTDPTFITHCSVPKLQFANHGIN